MAQAEWNGVVLAESDKCEVVDGNHYFPADSIRREFFIESGTRSTCPWKGEACYYTLKVGASENVDAAWYYPAAKAEAKHFEGFVAFWKGVEVRD